jgi:hypothetical protein
MRPGLWRAKAQRKLAETRAGGQRRFRLRQAWNLPYLLYMLWHDVDFRWAFGRGYHGANDPSGDARVQQAHEWVRRQQGGYW